MNRNWLDDIIVVNENDDLQRIGDIQVYRSEGDLGRKLERWYVNEVIHMALTGTGDKAILGLRGDLVIVERREPYAAGASMLHQWLTAKAQATLSSRKERERQGKAQLGMLEAKGILPETIEGLIAYVGFES